MIDSLTPVIDVEMSISLERILAHLARLVHDKRILVGNFEFVF